MGWGMKYRKKPVVVEAFQMTLDRRTDNSEWPEWLHAAWNADSSEPGSVHCSVPGSELCLLNVVTLEGVMRVEFNDYIIQGVQGELYPCKPDIFEATYEVVVEPMGPELMEQFKGLSRMVAHVPVGDSKYVSMMMPPTQAPEPDQAPELADSDDVTCFTDHVGGSS